MTILITAIVTTLVWVNLIAGIVAFVKVAKHNVSLNHLKLGYRLLTIACAILGCAGIALALTIYGLVCVVKELRNFDQPRVVEKPKAPEPTNEVIVEQVPVQPLPQTKKKQVKQENKQAADIYI